MRLRLSGLLDFEGYFLDQPTPALIYTESDYLFNPRLTVFLDTQITPYVYAFAQARVDRGFDPSDERARRAPRRIRDRRFAMEGWLGSSLKAGKFGTVVGNWVAAALLMGQSFHQCAAAL